MPVLLADELTRPAQGSRELRAKLTMGSPRAGGGQLERVSTVAVLTLALVVTVGGATAPPNSAMLRSPTPCQVFLPGETIRFRVVSAGPEARLRALDYDGREVWAAPAAPGDLVLPPLPSGYYRLEWGTGHETRGTSFVVLTDGPAGSPERRPLAVDGATSWLCGPRQWKPVAEMVGRIGMTWIRERLSWGEVQPDKETFSWGKYDTVARELAGAGVRTYQIYHDSPAWTRPGKDTRYPDDLRDVYRFSKAAAKHWAGRVWAWEPWNEPDIGFFDQLSDKYAGIQKAAYLGFKAARGDVPVLTCSLCRGRSGFSDGIFASGIADYADAFNFHTYDPIGHYDQTIRSWVELVEAYGMASRPIWLTEAGVRLEHSGRGLSAEDERVQADFVPRSFGISLANGVDQHFFFVLPHYKEGAIQFGALNRDLSPRPALAAIATAVRLLGEGRFAGRVRAGEGQPEVLVFDNGDELVALAWSESATRVVLPVKTSPARVFDVVGRERQVVAHEGSVELEVTASAQYVVGIDPSFLQRLLPPPRLPGKRQRLDPSKTIVVAYAENAPIDKDRNAYTVQPSEPLTFVIDTYNMDERRSVTGRVRLEPPNGWTTDVGRLDISLGPMGRHVERITIRPTAGVGPAPVQVTVRGEFGGEPIAPSVSYLRMDLTHAEPVARESLGLDAKDGWSSNISSNGTMSVADLPGGGVSFSIRFDEPGDRWAYPAAKLAGIVDWSRWHGIAFEYRLDTDDPGTTGRVQVIEDSGASYISGGLSATRDWRRAVVLFADLGWGSFSTPDPNGRLDLTAVKGLLVGCNTAIDELTLQVRNLELVAYGK